MPRALPAKVIQSQAANIRDAWHQFAHQRAKDIEERLKARGNQISMNSFRIFRISVEALRIPRLPERDDFFRARPKRLKGEHVAWSKIFKILQLTTPRSFETTTWPVAITCRHVPRLIGTIARAHAV